MFFRKDYLGNRFFTLTISRWVRGCIFLPYMARGLDPLLGIAVHSLREVAASAAYQAFPSRKVVFHAATYKSGV